MSEDTSEETSEETRMPPSSHFGPRSTPQSPPPSPRPSTAPPLPKSSPAATPTSPPTSPPKYPARFPIRIGATVFGTPTYFDLGAAAKEFQTFITDNTKFDLQWVSGQHPPLSIKELQDFGNGTYFINPATLSPENAARIPSNVAVNFVLFDTLSIKPCYGGLTYHQKIPFIGIPFGNPISWWTDPPWKHKVAAAMVHEFHHATSDLFLAKGYKLPNADECSKFGYTSANDPGYVNCLKHLYKQITDEMYNAICSTI